MRSSKPSILLWGSEKSQNFLNKDLQKRQNLKIIFTEQNFIPIFQDFNRDNKHYYGLVAV